MKTICLTMIVKNESKIIERLLNSCINIIDTFCICDTGSTDNTIELIQSFFMKHDKMGKIIQEPFINFAHNRNIALKESKNMSDYILLLDADMVLNCKLTKEDFNNNLFDKYDYFQILQGNEEFYYPNTRIIKNTDECNYVGVTHEYINIPNNSLLTLNKLDVFIHDIGDGGSKQDKFERDIALLTQGILDEPEHKVRYTFYLAESYFNHGDLELSVDFYKKRIVLGGWSQEIWYSYYRIGLAHIRLNKPELAIFNWLEAYNILPERFENIYEIIKYYRVQSNKINTAWMFYKEIIGKTVNGDFTCIRDANIDEYLFLHKSIYSYLLYYEFTIIAYYMGIRTFNKEILYILNNSNDANINNDVLKNMKFYNNILNIKETYDLSNTLTYKDIQFNSSSSCIWKTKENNYAMNIRYVNYNIDDKGNYHDCDDHIITLNRYIEFTSLSSLEFEKDVLFDIPSFYKRYVGVEDVRVYNDKFIGTGEFDDGKLGLLIGNYSLTSDALLENKEIYLSPEFLEILKIDGQKGCEKNWVFYAADSLVYSWFPLILGKISDTGTKMTVLDFVSIKNMPKMFEYIRGSTCGVSFNSEIWFITHMVSYEQPRAYYHCFVVFDENMNLLRVSSPFKFSNNFIEYCLGFIIENEQVIISYSEWDRTTKINVYDLKYIQSLLFIL